MSRQSCISRTKLSSRRFCANFNSGDVDAVGGDLERLLASEDIIRELAQEFATAAIMVPRYRGILLEMRTRKNNWDIDIVRSSWQGMTDKYD